MRRLSRRVVPVALVLIALLVGASVRPAAAQQSIADARAEGPGATVQTVGTVTRAFGDFVRIQDESGPTGASGLVIRQTSGAFFQDVQDGTIQRGTVLEVDGTLSEFRGLLQINDGDLSSYTIRGTDPVPDPQTVTLADLAAGGEDYESELVRVEGISFEGGSGTFQADQTYTVVDGSGSFPFRVQESDETAVIGEPIPESAVVYEGVVGQFREEYQLIPVRPSDLKSERSFSFSRLFAIADEGSGTVSVDVRAFNLQSGDEVQVTVDVSAASTAENGVDVTGESAPQTLTFSGPDPAPQTLTFDVVDDTETEGVERLELTLSTGDGTLAAPRQFTLWVRDDATAQGTVAGGQSGPDLREALRVTYGDPPTLTYGAARDSLYRTIYNESGVVEGVYSGFQVTVDPDGGDASEQAGDGGINTEHSWPQSRGAGDLPARSNMHILFPARGEVNTARSNYPYGEIPDADTDRWFRDDQEQTTAPTTDAGTWSELDDSPSDRDARRFEPRDAVKGDVARAAFYFVTTYPDRADLPFFDVQKETLLQWHQSDPVTATEMRRNIIQASYQGNKLNPYVVDPSLAERAYAGIEAPRNVSARAPSETVELQWQVPIGGVVASYNVYRSTSDFSDPSAATRVNDEPVTATEFTDASVETGETYIYRITAVDGQGNESSLSRLAGVLVYPQDVDVSLTRSFDGVGETRNYELVALPGAVNRPLAETLSGSPRQDWLAFWDDGSDEDFLVEYGPNDTFALRPGRGFWLVSAQDWTVDDQISTVSLASDRTATIPLHDGWTIISNPFDRDVAWADVEAANGGDLQALWRWNDGAFEEAAVFASAQSGEAFYFLNDQGLDALTLPYPTSASESAPSQDASAPPTLRLTAAPDGSDAAAARLEVAFGGDARDQVAPPGAFAPVRLVADGWAGREGGDGSRTARQRWLAVEARPSLDGDEAANAQTANVQTASPRQALRLRLTRDAEAPVRLRASLQGGIAPGAVVLVDSTTGRRYDLLRDDAVLRGGADARTLGLFVGPSGTVPDASLPSTVDLTRIYPNPVRREATFAYALPEAADVRLEVFDLLGRRVATVTDTRRPAGRHDATWTVGDVASGVYLARFTAAGQSVTRKVVVVK